MEKEIVDIFNENMELIGTAPRSEAHEKGLWHHSFHCWVIRKKGEEHFVLFQKRGAHKKLYPDTLDITAAGHIVSGETPEEGIRELNEELGIEVTIEKLIYLGIRCDVAKIGNVVNREFCHTYLFECDKELDEYKLQLDEVAGLVEINVKDGLKLFNNEKESIKATGFEVIESGELKKILIEITKKDIIPRLDGLYTKIFIMTQRYFNGEKYLSV
jgi:isopentenyldiphosphate isomerase